MLFSFVIINYNTAEITKNCLQSIFSNCKNDDFEIILIDNNSVDNSVEILKRDFKDKIKLIKNQENLGFARANNQGANIAQGKYLFFLNSDTILERDILDNIKRALTGNDKLGAIAPQLITSTGNKQVSAYGKYPRIIDLVVSKINKKIEAAKSLQLSVDWLSGAAIVIPKKVFTEIGGWDENFFMYFEDVDICRRIKQRRYSIVVQTNNPLVHLSGQSLKKNKRRRQYYYQSQNYYFKKHHGLLSLLLLKIIRWPYKKIMLAKD